MGNTTDKTRTNLAIIFRSIVEPEKCCRNFVRFVVNIFIELIEISCTSKYFLASIAEHCEQRSEESVRGGDPESRLQAQTENAIEWAADQMEQISVFSVEGPEMLVMPAKLM